MSILIAQPPREATDSEADEHGTTAVVLCGLSCRSSDSMVLRMSVAEMCRFIRHPVVIGVVIASIYTTTTSVQHTQPFIWNRRAYHRVREDSEGEETYGVVLDRILWNYS